MLQREAEIINKLGLHARASAKLTQVAGKFRSDIWLSRNGRRVNAKSIMGVMMLAAPKARPSLSKPTARTRSAAMQACRQLIADRFGEGNSPRH
jgi:phosphocarrier protein HPr